ncbi:TPA: hypothetical protein ACGOSU_000850 [Streptococcus suis]
MTRYIFSKNFFFRNAGIRLDSNIREINSLIEKNYQAAHEYFKSIGNLASLNTVSKTRLTNIKISETNNSIIGKIRNLKLTNKNPHFIPEASAEAIVDNVILERKYQRYLYRGQLYSEKRYYNNVQEVYWGTLEELKNKELLFFYVICRDMLNSKIYRELIEGVLKDYIPYAEILAYRDIELDEEFDVPYELLFPEIELDTVAIIQDEAIYRFYQLYIVDKIDIGKLFFDNLEKPVLYWSGRQSRDEQKIKRVKISKKDFSRFDEILDRFVNEYIKPIFEQQLEKTASLGLRVYSIFRNDTLELANLLGSRIDGQTVSDSDFQKAENLVSISGQYAKELELQQKSTENISLTIPEDLISYKLVQDILIKIDVEDNGNTYLPIEKLIAKYQSHL